MDTSRSRTRSGQTRSGQTRSGQTRSGQTRSGQTLSRPVPSGFVRRHVRLLAALGVLAVVAALVVLTVFQPQKLVLDTTVDEALPAPPAAAPAAPAAQPGPAASRRGDFRPLAHPGSGTASLLRLAGGEQVVRLENLDVENGPDLRVYLSAASVDADGPEHGRRFADLGELKGNRGNQNYPVPADVDTADYRSVVVWCRRFSVAFAAAPLAS